MYSSRTQNEDRYDCFGTKGRVGVRSRHGKIVGIILNGYADDASPGSAHDHESAAHGGVGDDV